jgi:hypothetical protein
MARVPTYEGDAVRQEALPVVQRQKQLPLETFGGGQSQEKLSNAVLGFVEKAKQDADQVAVLDADRQISEYETKRLYDPKTGALNKKGKDAFGVSESTMTALEKDASEIEGTLSNNSQKMAFRQRFASRATEVNRTLERHVGAEMAEYDQVQTKAFKENRLNYALTNFQDMDLVEKSIQESQGATLDWAKRNGVSKDAQDMVLLQDSSEISLGVINQMLDNNMYSDARDFFKENKEHFTAKDIAKANDLLKVGTLKGESMAKANEIFGKAKSLTEARSMLKDIKDNPELYDATEDRITNLYAKQKQAKEFDEGNRYDRAFDIAEKAKSVDAIPTALWASLSGEDHIKIRKAMNDPDSVAANSDAYLNAKMMAATPELRKEFLETSPAKLRGQVTPSELKDIMSDWTGLKNKDPATAAKLDGYYTKDQIEKSMLLEAGIDVEKIKPGSKDAKLLDQYKSYASRQVAARQRELGRELNNEELRGEINMALQEGMTSKGWFGNNKPKRVFQLVGDEEQFVIPIDEIPAPDKLKIVNYLKSRKQPVTDEAIADKYSKYLRGLNGK